MNQGDGLCSKPLKSGASTLYYSGYIGIMEKNMESTRL